jgi:hypothetical protein
MREGWARGLPTKIEISFFVQMIVYARDKGNSSAGVQGVRRGTSQSPKILSSTEREVYEMKCDCVLGCILTRGKSHVNINMMIWNSYLESDFFPVGILSIRFLITKFQPIRYFV